MFFPSHHFKWLLLLSLMSLATSQEEEEAEPATAVLFPTFMLVLGTLVYFCLSRAMPWLPYTAAMFVIGTCMGVASARLDNNNYLKDSMDGFWKNIDSEVLLLTFLPGSIFQDSFHIDTRLLEVAFWQCINFAFPVVLAGTCLTALVAYYIFPYNWSFDFCMMFGAILSATDPVAVNALLESLGAPARLKIHISGESLMNDGSAMVFYTIFRDLYLYTLTQENELDPPLGQDVGVAKGFGIFFRMSLGGVACGIFFGLGALFLLWILKRRLDLQENIVETATTLGMAYITYFTTDFVWGCSGVIGTMTMGLMVNKFGNNLFNDRQLLDDFWSIVDHIINSVLFALGGLVWGSIIANSHPTRRFEAQDWGYLFALYCFLNIIRFFLLFANYPLTVHIGLKTNVKETLFDAWGGLRGAVGISLAIAIDNIVKGTNVETDWTVKLFGMVGGTAFLTLLVNATLAGPLLKKLGLIDQTEVRKNIVESVDLRARTRMIDDMVELLSQPRFAIVDFGVVRQHIPMLQTMTAAEFIAAVNRYNTANSYKDSYRAPFVKNVLSYLNTDKETGDIADSGAIIQQTLSDDDKDAYHVDSKKSPMDVSGALPLVELRRLFLELVGASYAHNVNLDDREFLGYSMKQSIVFSSEHLSEDKPLDDWDYTNVLKSPFNRRMHGMVNWMSRNCKCLDKCLGPRAHVSREIEELRYDIDRYLTIVHGHDDARQVFTNQYVIDKDNLSESEQKILQESQDECDRAHKEVIEPHAKRHVQIIVSHRFCICLLNQRAGVVEEQVNQGLLKDKEAEDMLETIQNDLGALEACDHEDYHEKVDGIEET